MLLWLLRCVPKDPRGKVFGLTGRLKFENYMLVMATVWSRVTDAVAIVLAIEGGSREFISIFSRGARLEDNQALRRRVKECQIVNLVKIIWNCSKTVNLSVNCEMWSSVDPYGQLLNLLGAKLRSELSD